MQSHHNLILWVHLSVNAHCTCLCPGQRKMLRVLTFCVHSVLSRQDSSLNQKLGWLTIELPESAHSDHTNSEVPGMSGRTSLHVGTTDSNSHFHASPRGFWPMGSSPQPYHNLTLKLIFLPPYKKLSIH